ncbi:hypothetical protein EF908_01840 [Streptomyces sp. WAC04770]|nr:hypothetical protein EF908_01840 [Streptomyces sp. WAC04770]
MTADPLMDRDRDRHRLAEAAAEAAEGVPGVAFLRPGVVDLLRTRGDRSGGTSFPVPCERPARTLKWPTAPFTRLHPAPPSLHPAAPARNSSSGGGVGGATEPLLPHSARIGRSDP